MTSERLFVWIYLPGQIAPVVAGKLELSRTPAGAIGRFVYGRSYVARREAVPIDPVRLPLREAAAEFTVLSGFPGAVLDACPDRWGIKVIDRLTGKRDYPAGYLLLNDPGRAGCLAFSCSANEAPEELASRQFPLAELLAATRDVEAGRPVDVELLKALHPGTGGARPKCNIVDGEAVWIAKFSSVNDDPAIDIPRLEHATMRLGRLCGIRTAETRILDIDGVAVCLVRRFDRDIRQGEIFRTGFLSARTVFYADHGYAAVVTGSYARLARWLPRYGCPTEQRQEVFRRMVFNCAIRNSDDHELNHGLAHVGGGDFTLAPAYDLVPVSTPHRVHHHALLIGDSAAGTVSNLVGNAAAFGLGREEALAIVADTQRVIRECWREVCYEAGLGDEALRRIEHVFLPIPA